MMCSFFTDKWSRTLFFWGTYHFLLLWLLIGWPLSIYWGVLIIRKAMGDKEELQ